MKLVSVGHGVAMGGPRSAVRAPTVDVTADVAAHAKAAAIEATVLGRGSPA